MEMQKSEKRDIPIQQIEYVQKKFKLWTKLTETIVRSNMNVW